MNEGLRRVIYQEAGFSSKEMAGLDSLEPFFFFKLASAGPLCHVFNQTLLSNEIPKDWKSAFNIPILKGDVPTILNNYRTISKL